MRRYFLFLLMFCVVSAKPVAAQQSKTLEVRPRTGVLAGQTAYTNSYAILIGVGDYAFLPKDKHLDFAAKDATDLRDVLIRNYGFPAENVTVLLDAQATRANIEAALSTLADDRVKPDDRILIYFSGHGQTVKLQDGGEMGFLIPYDANVDLAHPENRSGYLATCLRMDSIWGYLEASAAKHRLLIADSCFGGLLIKGKALSAEKPNRAVIASLLARPAMQAMSAGASNEEAQEDPKLGHSTYTFKLLEELKAQAATPDSVFLASELAAALKTSVGNLTDSKQTPQFGNYHGTEGDFVFVATEPQPVPAVDAPVAPAQAIAAPMPKETSSPQQAGQTKFDNDTGKTVSIPAGMMDRADDPLVFLTVADRGTIVFELFPKDAPETVAHFLELVESKFYDGILFHRVISRFVAQAGDPKSKTVEGSALRSLNEAQVVEQYHLGDGGSGRTVPFEKNGHTNNRGTLVMCLSGIRNATGDSQFFLNLVPNHNLDGNYCVFGKIVKGLDVMDKLRQGDRITSIRARVRSIFDEKNSR